MKCHVCVVCCGVPVEDGRPPRRWYFGEDALANVSAVCVMCEGWLGLLHNWTRGRDLNRQERRALLRWVNVRAGLKMKSKHWTTTPPIQRIRRRA
jgi:hypothetical protein